LKMSRALDLFMIMKSILNVLLFPTFGKNWE